MPKQLIINSSNYSSGSSKFIYKFPVRQQFKKGDQVGLSSVSIYNSFYNISSAYNNNTFTLVFPSLVIQTQVITIPSGYYSISDLNYFLQQQCIKYGFYCTSSASTTSYIYFMEFVTNSVRYAAQLNFYLLSSNTGTYSVPSGFSWAFPTVAVTPKITFDAPFGLLLGFTANTYPLTGAETSNIQYVSPITPTLSVVNSLILTCNLINNHGISIPSSVFNSITLNAGFGSLITMGAGQIIMSDIATNDYDRIEIQMYDQNLNLLSIIDPDVLITLSLDVK